MPHLVILASHSTVLQRHRTSRHFSGGRRRRTEVDAVKSVHQGLDLRAVAVLLGLRDRCRERHDDGLDLKQTVITGIGLGA
jgi:hypothetical protein